MLKSFLSYMDFFSKCFYPHPLKTWIFACPSAYNAKSKWNSLEEN